MPSKRKASSASKAAADSSSSRKSKRLQVAEPAPAPEVSAESDDVEELVMVDASEDECESWARPKSRQFKKASGRVAEEKTSAGKKGGKEEEEYEGECVFTSEPVPDNEARERWPHRYQQPKKNMRSGVIRLIKSNDDEDAELIPARRHFTQARVDGQTYNLYDDAYVKAGEGEDSYICKIVEMFEAEDRSFNFTAQWYYRAKDTVIGECGDLIDTNCVFYSEIKNDNPLDCLLQRLKIVHMPSNVDLDYKDNVKAGCDYYYEKKYLLPYSTFVSVPPNRLADDIANGSETESTVSTEVDGAGGIASIAEVSQGERDDMEMTLLDIYSGCGAMSTGLCLGASCGDVKLVTKWAVDLNEHASDSIRLNHPETQVRNESAEDFLSLLKEWEKLCASYSLIDGKGSSDQTTMEDQIGNVDDGTEEEEEEDDGEADSEVFEVGDILDLCYGDPNKNKKTGLHFKIRWKGYGPDDDTWEPLESLSDCKEKLREFVFRGYKSKLLPLPGKVDVICGGPPCQGISGFNRFRNKANPLADEKNKQLQVFMDIVSFLKPKFVLMENVVDIIKFAEGFLGRYALARLVGLGYQARMGMLAAGAYGLPQFRMRVFMWGALPTEKLPQYPLPTHKVIVRGVVPTMFESNVVAYEEGHNADLETELFLSDAISDLPPVENNEQRDEIPYDGEPKTKFQHFIRLKKEVMLGCSDNNSEVLNQVLYDHRPLQLNDDDYQRVTKIPHKKGANFRDLTGVIVNPATKKVEWDPDVERVYLPSGKPLVPDYAMSFVGGSSSKPFGRLWWDETVPTVVGRAEPHNQVILHPVQDRVLTIRENARLQGFPDYYKLVGPVKQRYIQVGNAVAVPVARALGYCLALASKGLAGNEPVLTLPTNFSKTGELISPAESS